MIGIVSDDFQLTIELATPLRRKNLTVLTQFSGKIKNQIKRLPPVDELHWLIIIENGEYKLRNTYNKRQESLTKDEVLEGLLDLYFDDYSDGPEYMQRLYTTMEDLCSK